MMASQLPSPSSSASLSPRQPTSLGMSRHPSDHSDHSASANEERSPLDIRREKNRIKQRNLRRKYLNLHSSTLRSVLRKPPSLGDQS